MNCLFQWEVTGALHTHILHLGVGLRPLARWDCGFESRQGHGRLPLGSPTICGGSECDLETPIMRRPGPELGYCTTGKESRKFRNAKHFGILRSCDRAAS